MDRILWLIVGASVVGGLLVLAEWCLYWWKGRRDGD